MNLLMISGDVSAAQGRETTFTQMLRRFSRYWDRIDILCPRAPDATPRTLYDNVHVHPAPNGKLTQPLYIRNKGRALASQRRYDLITSHDFGFFYNGLGAAWLSHETQIPYVSELHHIEGYPHAVTTREKIYRAVAMRYIKWAKDRVLAFRVVNGVEVPELLRSLGVPDAKIRLLHALYIDFSLFHPQPDTPKIYDAVFVGRLVPNKGIFTLLDALASVRTTHPHLRAALRGRGAQEHAIRARIDALGLQDHVALMTDPLPPEAIARFYNEAKTLICASTVEGGPRVTVEAMACGVPVISTPVGVMRELIVDGENGLLFDWSAAQLADKLRQLLDDDALRQRIGAAGQATVQPFDAESVIARYAHGYQDLISENRRS